MYIHGQERHPRRTKLRGAETGWVRDFAPWSHWIGLTFHHRVTVDRANGALRMWARGLAREEVRAHLPLAYAAGPQASGAEHFHVLVALPEPVFAFEAITRSRWLAVDGSANRPHVRPYQRNGGAVPYMLAHLHWDLGTVCPRWPRCRRKGCDAGPAPW